MVGAVGSHPGFQRAAWCMEGVGNEAVTPDETIKDPYVLEFLDLKDEYSESDRKQPVNTP